jgi:hypothetical protein
VVHHPALEARVGAVFDVVVDRAHQVGHVGAQVLDLVDGAAGQERALQQLDAAVLAALHGAHAHQFVEHRANRHVAAVAAHQRGKAGRALLQRQHARRAILVGEVGVAGPGAEHADGAVVASGRAGGRLGRRVRRRLRDQPLNFLAGQARQDRGARDRRLLAGDAEVAQRHVHVHALGQGLERDEGHAVMQQHAEQRAEQALDASREHSGESVFSVHGGTQRWLSAKAGTGGAARPCFSIR